MPGNAERPFCSLPWTFGDDDEDEAELTLEDITPVLLFGYRDTKAWIHEFMVDIGVYNRTVPVQIVSTVGPANSTSQVDAQTRVFQNVYGNCTSTTFSLLLVDEHGQSVTRKQYFDDMNSSDPTVVMERNGQQLRRRNLPQVYFTNGWLRVNSPDSGRNPIRECVQQSFESNPTGWCLVPLQIRWKDEGHLTLLIFDHKHGIQWFYDPNSSLMLDFQTLFRLSVYETHPHHTTLRVLTDPNPNICVQAMVEYPRPNDPIYRGACTTLVALFMALIGVSCTHHPGLNLSVQRRGASATSSEWPASLGPERSDQSTGSDGTGPPRFTTPPTGVQPCRTSGFVCTYGRTSSRNTWEIWMPVNNSWD